MAGKTSELSLIIMDEFHWFWVLGESGMLKTISNVIARFLTIFANSTRLVVVLMHVRAKNSISLCGVEAGQEPMKSTVTSAHKAQAMF